MAVNISRRENKQFFSKKTFHTYKQFFFGSRKRTAISCIVLFLVLIFVGKTAFLSNTKPKYQTEQVAKGTIIASVSESGNVAANNQVNVSSPTDGVVTDVYVKNGDIVEAGNNLFSVQSTATPLEQEQAYATYLSAQNTINTAKAKLNSLQENLFVANQAFVNDKGIANPDTSDPKYIEENAAWLQAQADYTNQQGVITQAEAAFNAAWLSYVATQNATVTAPTGGTIANLSIQKGSAVTTSTGNTASSSTSSSSTPALVIGDFSSLVIKVQISEMDIAKIHAGEKATITLDAFPDKTFVGTVTNVDTIGTTSSGVVTYNAYITLLNPPSDIQPGMSASAFIQTQRKDDVLYVPSNAVQTLAGQSFIRVMKNGKVTQVPVTTGIASDTDTEIDSGLSEGDTIVTSIQIPTTASNQLSSPFSGFGGRGFGGGGNVRVIQRGQ